MWRKLISYPSMACPYGSRVMVIMKVCLQPRRHLGNTCRGYVECTCIAAQYIDPQTRSRSMELGLITEDIKHNIILVLLVVIMSVGIIGYVHALYPCMALFRIHFPRYAWTSLCPAPCICMHMALSLQYINYIHMSINLYIYFLLYLHAYACTMLLIRC